PDNLDDQYDSYYTSPGCAGCSVGMVSGELRAQIQGGADSVDSAYGLRNLGSASGVSGRVYIRDEVRLNTGQQLGANLAILQLWDTSKRIILEIYLAPDRTIHLWSAAGSLSSGSINLASSYGVPNSGTSRRLIEVSAAPNDSVIVRIDGSDAMTQSGLSGA